nr:putative reverse transcriptase domain-containing protein [Tanacetum cinerariifolium]
MRIEPDLISRIKEAQKEDSEIWTIVENLDKQVEFHLDNDNVLWQDTSSSGFYENVSRGKRLFLSLRFFGGTIPSGKPLGKPRSLSGLLILISFHDM